MSNCRHCNSDRIGYIQAHSKDLSIFQYQKLDIDTDGYFPYIPGICGGDDAEFLFCLECGMIQSDTFPITDEVVKEATDPEDDDEEEMDDFRENPAYQRLSISSELFGDVIVKGLTGFWELDFVKTVEEMKSFKKWLITIDPETEKHYLITYHSDDGVKDYFFRWGKIDGDEDVAFTYIDWADFNALEKKR